MTPKMFLRNKTISIAISEPDDLAERGVGIEHIQDAMAEIARHLLALGATLAYGGDLRGNGFTRLLFELVARHSKKGEFESGCRIINYLAWPVHAVLNPRQLNAIRKDIQEFGQIVLLDVKGKPCPPTLPGSDQRELSDLVWARGLTAMRIAMTKMSDARIVLGGAEKQYRGAMPGVLEESLLSLNAQQPLYVVGGFGGCASLIARGLGLQTADGSQRSDRPASKAFASTAQRALNNGLVADDAVVLANTQHIDEAVALIIRGLLAKFHQDSVG